MGKLYRQGDVLVERIRALPKNLRPVPRENGKVILAHGEVTGHFHAFDESGVALLESDESTEDGLAADRYLRIDEPATLRHHEHDAIEFAPGVYRVRRQREYSPEALRNVAD